MEEFVSFDPDVHIEDFIQMNIDYLTWVSEQLYENYRVDAFSVLGQTIPEWVDDNLEPYISLKPPEGILYILEVDGDVAGMGVLKKLSDGIGEIKRMYNRPQYRRRGYARRMLNILMEAGREYGISTFQLDTPKFSVAHHLYRSTGFIEREAYPGSEIPPMLQPYWIWMEKKEEKKTLRKTTSTNEPLN